eukprot:PLAT11167.2.p2 GENE.PLAT11167.2~~PLAT11167.2.p2  ORF type:complete len:106 (+),score=26.57 PLAT11167.2:531-848(+)
MCALPVSPADARHARKLLSSFGRLRRLLVCRNQLPHLRGSVYAQFYSALAAQAATRALRDSGFPQARRLQLVNWQLALCLQFERSGRCSRGDDGCELLHTADLLQ